MSLDDPMLKISVVTRCELFSGRNVDETVLRRTLSVLEEVPLDRVTAEAAGRLRRTADMALADALIAACALEHDLSLMTRNVRHFERVPGLLLHHPDDGTPAGA